MSFHPDTHTYGLYSMNIMIQYCDLLNFLLWRVTGQTGFSFYMSTLNTLLLFITKWTTTTTFCGKMQMQVYCPWVLEVVSIQFWHLTNTTCITKKSPNLCQSTACDLSWNLYVIHCSSNRGNHGLRRKKKGVEATLWSKNKNFVLGLSVSQEGIVTYWT